MIFGKEGETEGEKLVYESLSTLSDEWIIYSQPTIVCDSGNRYPDFVVLNEEIGLLVIEVKDWLVITNYDADSATVRNTTDSIEQAQDSPVKQARNACFAIQDELLKHAELRSSTGKLNFPWRFAGILTKQHRYMVNELRKSWGRFNLFSLADLSAGNVELTLRSVPAPFSSRLGTRQIDLIRSVIDPRLNVGENGIYNITQESIAKEDSKRAKKTDNPEKIRLRLSFDFLKRVGNLEENLPDEVIDSSNKTSVRLIRGMAGTGKTDVIILRCHYLTETRPDDNVLVTTFNVPISEARLMPVLNKLSPTVQIKRFSQICQEIQIAKFGKWVDPQSTEGVVNAILDREPRFLSFREEFGSEFLVDEIQWIKEMELTTKKAYTETIREGRGGSDGRSLSRNQKEHIFDFFLTYQEYLSDLPAIDWNDLYHRAVKYIQTGEVKYQQYDEILIDEAQHFAPKWIELMLLLLKENGKLFLCEDPSQSVYRAYSWKQKGVEVRGRTKWLRVPYRSTKQILRAAYSLIENNQTVMKLLSEEGGFDMPDLDSEHLRDGSVPELHHF